ncbi:MAG: hypothetical protein JNJ90_14900 [Saprospiraceae bacterium]|jgi:hypothetical protein|nr:hypothetical protein [Saprospiraceae bacterium]
MKPLFLLALLLTLPTLATTQCYTGHRDAGKKLLTDKKYDEAIVRFEAAKKCLTDKPAGGDKEMDGLIAEAKKRKNSSPSQNKSNAKLKPAKDKAKKKTDGQVGESAFRSEQEETKRMQDEAAEQEQARKAQQESAKKKDSTFGKRDSTGTGQGNTDKPGDQGIPTNPFPRGSGTGAGNGSGVGESIGDGLSGRRVVGRPKMVDNTQNTGCVAVRVCVAADGSVTTANYTLAGSTTNNPDLRSKAESWARQFRFAPSNVEEQCGTLTFNFMVK